MIEPTTPSKTNLAHTPLGPRSQRKILFASAHSIVDFSNGASVATLDMLQGLSALGFDCQAFCTPKLDVEEEVPFEKIITDLREPYQVRDSVCGADRARVLYTRRRQVPITVIRLPSTRHVRQSPEEVHTVLQFFVRFLDVYRPDVMLTYGGDPVTVGMITLAKRRGIPVLFAIHNFAYAKAHPFRQVDYCIVPSRFAQRFYRDHAGVLAQALPNPVDWQRVRAQSGNRQFVTFVNPSLPKGVYPFARIAAELGRRRPDIPLLIVESRGKKETLAACGVEPSARVNLDVMPNTTDPRRFWKMTRIALLPSLWLENQPLTAIEAMINGIPVIGSDRGGTPETVGSGGVVLPLPGRLTPITRILPTAEEVEPWVETVIRLWDDRAWYDALSRKARNEAQRWHPDRLRPLYADFFGKVRLQAGPPLMSVAAGKWRVTTDNGNLRPGPPLVAQTSTVDAAPGANGAGRPAVARGAATLRVPGDPRPAQPGGRGQETSDVVVTEGWLDQLSALANAKTTGERERVGGQLDAGAAALTPRGPAIADGGKHRPGRADVELCGAAATGRGRVVPRPGRDADLCATVARRASGEMVHRSQAVGLLRPDQAGRLRDGRRSRRAVRPGYVR